MGRLIGIGIEHLQNRAFDRESESHRKKLSLKFDSYTLILFQFNSSVGRGDSSHFPHIYNNLKTGRAGIVCSSVMVVPHMTFMHSEYP